MAETRLHTLQDIIRPAIVRWGGVGVFLLGFYDVLCNQIGLPPLKELFGKTGSLMPWWGWLTVLQSLFVYALFEYVRQHLSVQILPSAESPVSTVAWDSWKKRNYYSIFEFAKILAMDEPASQELKKEASGYARLVLEQVNLNKIPHIPRYVSTHDGDFNRVNKEVRTSYDTEIPRAEALAWARANGFSTSHVD